MFDAKKNLRLKVKRELDCVPDSEREKWDTQLSYNLLKFLADHQDQISINSDNILLGGFSPMVDEANWPIGFVAWKDKIAFPVIDGENMLFKRCSPEELLENIDLGQTILEPPKSKETVYPGALLVPGRAFGIFGERLGRGKGFYDRFLETYKGHKIGVCYDSQILEGIPMEENDIPMDYVITEKRTLVCAQVEKI